MTDDRKVVGSQYFTRYAEDLSNLYEHFRTEYFTSYDATAIKKIRLKRRLGAAARDGMLDRREIRQNVFEYKIKDRVAEQIVQYRSSK